MAWGRASTLVGQEGRWLLPQTLPLSLPSSRITHIAVGHTHALILARTRFLAPGSSL